MFVNSILLHYGEIALKGRNRPAFQKQLVNNIVRRLRARGLDWRVAREHHRIEIAVGDHAEGAMADALSALGETPGIVWFAPARKFDARLSAAHAGRPELEEIAGSVETIARERYQAGAGFAIRVKRADKQFPLTSQELERELGARVLRATPWQRVDLDAPDVTINLEIDAKGLYLYSDRHEGMGGLPVGTSGRVVALLSGGLDSPVAVYLAAKRGCEIDCVHFTASRMQQAQAQNYKVAKLARDLSRFTLRTRLWLIPYLHFDSAMMQHATDYDLVLFRRFMLRIAERIAAERQAQALVTGDNLCQVASQTLENLAATTRAVEMPILRPLLTYDKQEIMTLARRIGTYDLSIQPYKDCCALVDRHPRTTSRHETLRRIEEEALTNYRELIDRSLEDAVVLEYECGNSMGQ